MSRKDGEGAVPRRMEKELFPGDMGHAVPLAALLLSSASCERSTGKALGFPSPGQPQANRDSNMFYSNLEDSPQNLI